MTTNSTALRRKRRGAVAARAEIAGKTQRRGAVAHHYQLTDRDRAAAIVWGTRAELLVTDFERQNGRGDVTVRLDVEAMVELHTLTAAYLARIGELGLPTRERESAGDEGAAGQTLVAVLLAAEAVGEAHGRSAA